MAERSQVALEGTGLVVAGVPCGVLGKGARRVKALKARVRPHSPKGLRLGMAMQL